jgi:hypothetical protein
MPEYDKNGRRVKAPRRQTKSTLQQLKDQIKNKTELSGNTSNSDRIITNLKTKLSHLDDGKVSGS